KPHEDDSVAGQPPVALRARTGRIRTLPEVALHGPRRPGLAKLDVEPTSGIDHMHASVNRGDTTQSVVGHRDDHQDLSGQHRDLSASVHGGLVGRDARPATGEILPSVHSY